MSKHCDHYPTCECPPEAGRYCHTKWPVEDIIKRNQADVKAQANLNEAFEKLSEEDKIAYHRGYKTFKTSGSGELMLVDNLPWLTGKRRRGTNLTPPKKKRKK